MEHGSPVARREPHRSQRVASLRMEGRSGSLASTARRSETAEQVERENDNGPSDENDPDTAPLNKTYTAEVTFSKKDGVVPKVYPVTNAAPRRKSLKERIKMEPLARKSHTIKTGDWDEVAAEYVAQNGLSEDLESAAYIRTMSEKERTIKKAFSRRRRRAKNATVTGEMKTLSPHRRNVSGEETSPYDGEDESPESGDGRSSSPEGRAPRSPFPVIKPKDRPRSALREAEKKLPMLAGDIKSVLNGCQEVMQQIENRLGDEVDSRFSMHNNTVMDALDHVSVKLHQLVTSKLETAEDLMRKRKYYADHLDENTESLRVLMNKIYNDPAVYNKDDAPGASEAEKRAQEKGKLKEREQSYRIVMSILEKGIADAKQEAEDLLKADTEELYRAAIAFTEMVQSLEGNAHDTLQWIKKQSRRINRKIGDALRMHYTIVKTFENNGISVSKLSTELQKSQKEYQATRDRTQNDMDFHVSELNEMYGNSKQALYRKSRKRKGLGRIDTDALDNDDSVTSADKTVRFPPVAGAVGSPKPDTFAGHLREEAQGQSHSDSETNRRSKTALLSPAKSAQLMMKEQKRKNNIHVSHEPILTDYTQLRPETISGVPVLISKRESPFKHKPLTEQRSSVSTVASSLGTSRGRSRSGDITFQLDKKGHGMSQLADLFMAGDSRDPRTWRIRDLLVWPWQHQQSDVLLEGFPGIPPVRDVPVKNLFNKRTWNVAQLFPNLNPSGREEVVRVEEWMEEKMAELKRMKNLHGLKHTQVIHTTVFYEVLREVSMHCSERGRLLSSLWKHMIDLFQRLMDVTNKEAEITKNLQRRAEESILKAQQEKDAYRDEVRMINEAAQAELRRKLETKELELEEERETTSELRHRISVLFSKIESIRRAKESKILDGVKGAKELQHRNAVLTHRINKREEQIRVLKKNIWRMKRTSEFRQFRELRVLANLGDVGRRALMWSRVWITAEVRWLRERLNDENITSDEQTEYRACIKSFENELREVVNELDRIDKQFDAIGCQTHISGPIVRWMGEGSGEPEPESEAISAVDSLLQKSRGTDVPSSPKRISKIAQNYEDQVMRRTSMATMGMENIDQ